MIAELALSLGLSMMAVGCSPAVDSASVVGRYVLNGSPGRDELIVRSDGTYAHLYEPRGRPVVPESGTWELEIVGNEPRVTFHGFSAHWDDVETTGIWSASVERSFGTVRLRVDDDLDLYYERQ